MKKILTYLLLVVCLSYVARELIYVGLRKNTSGEFDKLNTVFIKQNKYDALIVGSSRAESHFVPSVIDSVTGLNSFNAGQSGAMQQLNLALLRSYLVHSDPPGLLILNVDIHLSNAGNDTIHQFPKYFAYLGNDTLYKHLQKHDPRFKWFKWLPFYSLPYTNDHYLSASLHGWLDKNKKDYEKGFVPEEKWIQDLDGMKYPVVNYSPGAALYKSVSEIIAVCKQNNIRPVLVVSPLYYRLSEVMINKTATLNMLKQLANESDIIFLDYTNDEMCRNKNYFTNPRHLNKSGAWLFSQKFAGQLQQYLR